MVLDLTRRTFRSPDALGRQRSRLVGTTTETYAYLGMSETTWSVSDSAGGGWRSGFDASGGTRIATTKAATLSYLVPDLLGSLVASEGTGSTAISAAWRYDGYGQLVDDSTGAPDLDIGFFGALDRSPDAQPLYDIGARYYSPASGAWSQLDTVMGTAQDPRTMNRFLYAGANPTTLIDPSGHAFCGPDGIYCSGTSGAYDTRTAGTVTSQGQGAAQQAASVAPTRAAGGGAAPPVPPRPTM